MVLYYLDGAEHSKDVSMPMSIMCISYTLKGFQLGSIAGIGLGAGTGLLKSNINIPALVMHTVGTTRNVGLIGGPLAGFAYALSTSMGADPDDLKHQAFDIKEDVWMNRIDALSLGGAVYGGFASRQAVWTNLLMMPGKGVLGGGICFGCLAGMLVDVPLSIFGPVYFSNKDDFNFNHPKFFLSQHLRGDGEADEESSGGGGGH